MAKRTKKTHPERAVLKGSGGWVCCYKGTNVIRNNKTFSKKVSKKVMWGRTVKKRRVSAEHDSSYKRDEAIMKFRKKFASNKETTNIRTYKSFFSKKYQSLIFRYRIMLISFIHRALSRMRLLWKWREKYHRSIIN